MISRWNKFRSIRSKRQFSFCILWY